MSRSIAVVCVSGGLDSCVTVAIAAESHELALLHVNYGQRTEARELRCFRAIADFYRVHRRLVVDLRHLSKIGGSALTDRTIPVPRGSLNRTGIPATYVPFRNASILSAAVAWAETIGARAVYIGAVEEDSSGYPDCRESFFDAFREVTRLGTRPVSKIKVATPVVRMSKAQIVRKGLQLHAPLHLTWSCYRSQRIACGKCDSCLRRKRAFALAHAHDPVRYRGTGYGR